MVFQSKCLGEKLGRKLETRKRWEELFNYGRETWNNTYNLYIKILNTRYNLHCRLFHAALLAPRGRDWRWDGRYFDRSCVSHVWHLTPDIAAHRSSNFVLQDMSDVCVGTSVGTITEPECLGPCEPGTSVTLEGIVWHETEGGKNLVTA